METKKAIYQIIFLFVLITGALIGLVIYPIISDIQASADQILSDRGQVIFIDAENRELNSFKKEYKEYQVNLAKSDQLFADAKNPIDFIKFLEKIGSDAQITSEINLVPVSNDMSGGANPKMFFKIHARGNFLDVLVFLKKMESGQYLITVDSAKMKKFDRENSQSNDPTKKKNLVPSDIVDADFSINVLSNTPHP